MVQKYFQVKRDTTSATKIFFVGISQDELLFKISSSSQTEKNKKYILGQENLRTHQH